jgi:hypothetical protein
MDRVRFIPTGASGSSSLTSRTAAPKDVMKVMAEVQRIVTAQPRESTLILGDLTGAQFTRDAITRMKEVAVFDRPYVRRAAIVGAEVCLRSFTRDSRPSPVGISPDLRPGRKRWTGW